MNFFRISIVPTYRFRVTRFVALVTAMSFCCQCHPHTFSAHPPEVTCEVIPYYCPS